MRPILCNAHGGPEKLANRDVRSKLVVVTGYRPD